MPFTFRDDNWDLQSNAEADSASSARDAFPLERNSVTTLQLRLNDEDIYEGFDIPSLTKYLDRCTALQRLKTNLPCHTLFASLPIHLEALTLLNLCNFRCFALVECIQNGLPSLAQLESLELILPEVKAPA